MLIEYILFLPSRALLESLSDGNDLRNLDEVVILEFSVVNRKVDGDQKQDDGSHIMGPDVYGFVVNHEQRLNHMFERIHIYSIAFQYELIFFDVIGYFLNRTDKEVFLFGTIIFTIFLFFHLIVKFFSLNC